MRDYIPTVAATVLALFAVMARAQTPPATASGIEGVILVSPIRGGPIRIGEPSAAPVRNTQFIVKAGDAVVAKFTTDAEGRFEVALPPGHYVVTREGAVPRIAHWRFEADVVAGEMTKVNWTGDSGMR